MPVITRKLLGIDTVNYKRSERLQGQVGKASDCRGLSFTLPMLLSLGWVGGVGWLLGPVTADAEVGTVYILTHKLCVDMVTQAVSECSSVLPMQQHRLVAYVVTARLGVHLCMSLHHLSAVDGNNSMATL